MNVLHYFYCKKLSETIEFYKIFEFEVFKEHKSEDKSIRIVMLKNNSNEYIELFNYKEDPEYINSASTDLPVIGTKHIAFRVKDIKKVKEYVEKNNLSKPISIANGRLGRKYFFIKDLNGILIELIEEK